VTCLCTYVRARFFPWHRWCNQRMRSPSAPLRCGSSPGTTARVRCIRTMAQATTFARALTCVSTSLAVLVLMDLSASLSPNLKDRSVPGGRQSASSLWVLVLMGEERSAETNRLRSSKRPTDQQQRWPQQAARKRSPSPRRSKFIRLSLQIL